MKLVNQVNSLSRRLGELYPSWPIYMESMPQTFTRPCLLLAMERPLDQPLGVGAFSSTVTWKVVYYGTSRDDVLATADGLVYELLDPGHIAYFDYATTPPTATGRFMRVVSIEVIVEHDAADQFSATCRVTTVLRLSRRAGEAAAITGVHVSQSLVGR